MTIDSPITLRNGKNIGGTPPTNNLPPIGHPIDPSAATGAGGSIPPPLVSTQSGLPGVSPLHNNGLKSPPYITGLGEVLDDPASSVRGRHGSLANSEEEIAKEYMITFCNIECPLCYSYGYCGKGGVNICSSSRNVKNNYKTCMVVGMVVGGTVCFIIPLEATVV